MNTESTPLVNKLILALLILNSVFLGVLIVQQFRPKPALTPLPQARNASAEDSVALADGPERPVAANRPMPRVGPPTVQRAAPPPAPVVIQNPAPPELPVPVPPAIVPPVNFTLRPGVPPPPAPVGIPNQAGSEISGHVYLASAPPPERSVPLDKICAGLRRTPLFTQDYMVSQEGGLANAFVYIRSGLEEYRFPRPTNTPVLSIQGCTFGPAVFGLQTNQNFRIKNFDPAIHPLRFADKALNFSLRGQTECVTNYPRPEVFLRITCTRHDWETAYVGVLSHPYFAVTDQNGVYRFPGVLPPGKYVITAVHPKAGEASQEVILGEGEQKNIDLALGLAVTHP